MQAVQPMLIDLPLCGVYPITLAEANRLLLQWDHKLGELRRPFRNEGWALMLSGEPIAVATSSSIVHGPVDGLTTQEVVELSRLCAKPGNRWANRVMLRLWREVCAPSWPCWPVKAAVSYSHNAMHAGDIYRTDGWTRVKTNAGSRGGGSWSRERYAGDAHYGTKSLWVWRYPTDTTV